MNYRHAYHAGNFADVVKHVILARVIEHLKLKSQPFRIIDTHAGVGRYDLTGLEAGKTGEWEGGIGRLMAATVSVPVRAIFEPYLQAISNLNGGTTITVYPGSPLLARMLMRAGDQLVANELHGEDFEVLKSLFHKVPDTKVLNLDAWAAVKSLLPPKERRGAILIDPPFEKTGEFERLSEGVANGLRRFGTGTFVIWYPVKDEPAVARFIARVKAGGALKAVDARLWISNPHSTLGLAGTGVLIVNPPFRLKADLELILPVLASVLAAGPGAGFELMSWGDGGPSTP